MLILSFVLFGIALAIVVVTSIWTLVLAFQRHIGWGLAVLFVPFAQLIFVIKAWEEAKRPFLWSLVSILFVGAGMSTFDKVDKASVARFLGSEVEKVTATPKPEAKPALPAMFAAQKEAELKLRLIALQRRETELLDRKAALDPKDRAGAVALAEEIKKYNADLQPVLQQLRDNPVKTTSL